MSNYRVKNTKDIEAASETIVFNTSFTNSALNKAAVNLSPSITEQQMAEDTFDNELEKRK